MEGSRVVISIGVLPRTWGGNRPAAHQAIAALPIVGTMVMKQAREKGHPMSVNPYPVEPSTVRVDARGRITLVKQPGLLLDRQYIQSIDAEGTITLMPVVIIPQREMWVYENPEVLAALREGIAAAGRGETTPMDWTKHPRPELSENDLE